MFDPAVLDLSTESILDKFRAASNNMTNLSLGLGYSTKLSAPHTLLGGFKNLLAVAASTGYEFPEATAFMSAAAAGPATGGATAAAADAPAAKEEEAPKEEAEEVDMGDLFGGGDDEYY